MTQDVLFDLDEEAGKTSLGGNLELKVTQGPGGKPKATLYRLGLLMKEADLSDRVAKKLFVIDAIEMGAMPTRLAKGLGISRQTIHNYQEIKEHFGLRGLIQGYSLESDKSEQRKIDADTLTPGNKARELEKMRAQKREEIDRQQKQFNFSFGPDSEAKKVEASEQPYSEEHDWKGTRYAGVFAYLPVLTSQWRWLALVMGHFRGAYKILMVFLLMAARGIRSIEQLKNVRLREAGIALGIGHIPCKPKVWKAFYAAASMRISDVLHWDFFRYQIRMGLVGLWLWFTDGHLLPYTGNKKVHHSFNTQRDMPVPGQTNMVTCDSDGRIVDFEIQEGKGDLRARIHELARKWEGELGCKPVNVVDREVYSAPFFYGLIQDKIPFVTWEKYANGEELAVIDDAKFKLEFTVNGKEYAFFEEEKVFTYEPESSQSRTDVPEKHCFTLRRIVIWNKTSNRRTCGLAWTGDQGLSTEDCAWAILQRWGASENTFKHMQERHPTHYRPGFALHESEKQDIANPEVKQKEGVIRRLKKGLSGLYKKLSKNPEVLNKDGSPRRNSRHQRYKDQIEKSETELKRLQEEKKALPERVDVRTLADYKSFKKIDTEGKNLFDFVLSSVWNARKLMVEWLRPELQNDNEVVDLFYAITYCHGWVKSTPTEVIVRLEPLQQPKRRAAQEQLCRRLSGLLAQTPMGKWLILEVGSCPIQEPGKLF